MNTPPPPATGSRLHWHEIPAPVSEAAEAWLGSRVVAATTQPSGFSPGVAARLRTESGRGVFVKAAGPEPNPFTPVIHRREAAIMQALPAAEAVPPLLWFYDDPDGWVMLVFEDVEGRHPAEPWDAEELNRVLRSLSRLWRELTPTPVAASSAAEKFSTEICGYQRLLAEPPDTLDEWSRRNLETLAALEAAAPQAVAGETLVHMDIRADNLLLTENRVYVVDWPHACVGAAWVDLIGFAPSVMMQGGPDPETLLRSCPEFREADPEAITAGIVALAGYFTYRALLPPPPGLPTLRAFQAAQGAIARQWISVRTGLKG